MKRIALGATAALLAMASLASCDAKTLAGLAAGALADGPNARPSGPPSMAPTTQASPSAEPSAPVASASANAAASVSADDMAAIAYLKEKALATEGDPKAFAKLVVQALCYATRNKVVAADMLAYLSDNTLASKNAASSTGYKLGSNYLTFLNITLEKEDYHGYFFTKSGTSPTGDWKAAYDAIEMDEEYGANDRGPDAGGNYHVLYIKSRFAHNVRAPGKLTLSLGKSDAGPKAWRANNLSSLYVTYGFALPE